MGFLRIALQLIDSLAWPVLALGYPLCASIRAVETGSKYHMRKLVIYWTMFSFISLFENIFEKLIEWVPLWPYIKLIAICLLVIPQFNGACHFYQYLVHPYLLVKLDSAITQFYGPCYVYQRLLNLCLYVNLQTVTDWFNKPIEDPSPKNETFLDVAERFLDENGSDSLEKLIANKSKDYSLNHHAKEIKTTDGSDKAGMLTPNQTVFEAYGPVWDDIKVMEHMTKNEAAETKQVKSVKENLFQIEKKTTGMQVKEMLAPADSEEIKLPEITSSKEVLTEWTCVLCQVTTTSEHTMKVHLNGRRHNARYRGLKLCEQTVKVEGCPLVTTKSIQLNQELVKDAAAARSENSTNEPAPKQDKSVKKNLIQMEKKTTGVQVKLPEIKSSKKVQTEWTCAVCQVTTTSEHDLKCHLHGMRHREKCEELKSYKKTAKSERNMPDQLKQEQVKHALAAQRNEKQKQLKNAGAATHNPKLWCSLCNIRCPDETAMAAHLNGRKHMANIQETMSSTGGT